MNLLGVVLLFQRGFCMIDYDFYFLGSNILFKEDHHSYIYIKNVPPTKFGAVEKIAEKNDCEILSFAPYSLPFGGGDVKTYIFLLKRK